MFSLFTDYPVVPWKQGWTLSSGPEDSIRFITDSSPGSITLPEVPWTFQASPMPSPCITRLLSNGFSICTRKNPKKNRIEALWIKPGLLLGRVEGVALPTLIAPEEPSHQPGLTWIETDHYTTLLLCKEQQFALVTGKFSIDLAIQKAEKALDEDFEALIQRETNRRVAIHDLFSINPRHNPPVALAAESLANRLRSRTSSIHGLWSAAEVFEEETFSLNELYPLVQTWALIEPDIALELIRTALSLQQNNGGFPAWIDRRGVASTAAPWPLLAQTFEQAWQKSQQDPLVLKQTLPNLRKYIQWALRYFDPHRDGIPAWQSEQEIFVPGTFERDKATPELTVLLLTEMEALLRLCEQSDHAETALKSLAEEHDQLAKTLSTIFWNPAKKEFSNVWKNGHFIDEPSFGSFLPLLWENLDLELQRPLLETFSKTYGFPDHAEPTNRKIEEPTDENPPSVSSFHQFMAFEALRKADRGRAFLMRFVQRVREGFSIGFEQERSKTSSFELGPVTASLILTTQHESQRETKKNAPLFKALLLFIHRLHFNRSDLRILIIFGIAILMVHLSYTLQHTPSTEVDISEALINYRQGRFKEAMAICRRYPEEALSRFLQANLFMLADHPLEAEKLYRLALQQETGSPSALLGYALALQRNTNFEDAVRRYNDFLDIYEATLIAKGQKQVIELAHEFLKLAEENFSKPPDWKRLYTKPLMNDLGL